MRKDHSKLVIKKIKIASTPTMKIRARNFLNRYKKKD